MTMNNDPVSSPETRILTLDECVRLRNEWRAQGLSCALTNGCFDILHRGHAEYLLAARKLADRLIVLLNSDDSVRRLKGPSRPVNSEYDRAYLLSCFRFVDAVVIFSSPRCTGEIDVLKPDFYAKGADYTVETLNPEEREALFRAGTEIRFIPFVAGHSTTGTIQKLRGEKGE